jgi:glutamine phosphoribosylpyrophosphate amidotransferase
MFNTQKNKITTKAFNIALVGNEARGRASTGVLSFDGENTQVYKATKPASEVAYKNMQQTGNAQILLGHTRMPTVGDVSIRNAHPLYWGNWWLVHNGGVWRHEWHAKKIGWKLGKDYEVDSEVLLPLLGDWEEVADTASMAAILAWNIHTKKMYAFKVDNPLFVCEYDGGYLFSSRKSELEMVAPFIGSSGIRSFKKGELWEMDYNTGKIKTKKVETNKWKNWHKKKNKKGTVMYEYNN